MTFAEAYRELEDKFKWMVGKDGMCHGIQSVFLPNVERAHGRIGAGVRKRTPWCSLFGSICATRIKQSITSPIWLTVR